MAAARSSAASSRTLVCGLLVIACHARASFARAAARAQPHGPQRRRAAGTRRAPARDQGRGHRSARRLRRGRPFPARHGRVEPARNTRSRSAARNGYSAIWIGLGLRADRRHADDDRVRSGAREDGRRRTSAAPGLADIVTVVPGDAFKEIPKLAGDVRLRVPRRVEARLQAILRPRASRAWRRAASSSPTTSSTSRARCAISCRRSRTIPPLMTTIVTPGSEGMSVSLKLEAAG